MFNSHSKKFDRTNFAVKLAGHWVGIAKCKCGEVHAYWLLDKEPGAVIPRLPEESLSDEIRGHIISRRLIHDPTTALVAA